MLHKHLLSKTYNVMDFFILEILFSDTVAHLLLYLKWSMMNTHPC